MTNRRHASDREAGHGSYKIGIRAADGFSRVLTDAFLIDAVRTTGQDKDRLARLLSPEDQRFHNLTRFTTCAVRGFLSRARGFGMFDHRVIVSKRLELILNFLCGRGES